MAVLPPGYAEVVVMESAGIGALISVLVSALKRAPVLGPLVRRYPKTAAAVLSACAALVRERLSAGQGDPWALLAYALEQFAAAVAAYEAVGKPLARRMAEADLLERLEERP